MAEQELDNTWSRWQKLIVAELERLDRGLIGLHSKMDAMSSEKMDEIISIKVDVATLKEKTRLQAATISSVIGLISGILGAVITKIVIH